MHEEFILVFRWIPSYKWILFQIHYLPTDWTAFISKPIHGSSGNFRRQQNTACWCITQQEYLYTSLPVVLVISYVNFYFLLAPIPD